MTIREARKATGLTIEQAAKRARVSVSYLRAIERDGAARFCIARRRAALSQCDQGLVLAPGAGTRRERSIERGTRQ